MKSTVDRSRRPAGGIPGITPQPEFRRERHPQGLEVFLAPRADVPLVELELLLTDGGSDRNPADRAGLARLTASLLDEGTARHSGPELVADLERRGGALSTSAGWNAATIRLSLPSSELVFGLDLLGELALEPTFPERELERLRRRALAELSRRFDSPASLAEELFARTIYAGTVLAELPIGSSASLAAISRDDVVGFHERRLRQVAARLVVAGDLGGRPDLLVTGSLPPGLARSVARDSPPVTAPDRDGVVVRIVDRPDAAQTEVRVGHLGVSRRDPDRTALGFLNAILGGKFTSRLNLNLRERRGITYGVHSRLVDRKGRGPFLVSGAIANEAVGVAVRETLDEIRRLREEPIRAVEIDETRNYLLGVFPYGLQTVEALAARLRDIALHELPLDHASRVLEEYRTIDADRLRQVAAAHLHPERSVVVAAGPAATIAGQLEEIGEIEIRTPDPASDRL
ncbi:MAG: M16 family metallopeptidase [Thermoanaerobaculia bacterium]